VAIDGGQLLGRWVHVHEEDGEGEMVLRPADYSVPPSRGRLTLELREDGILIEGGPSPVARPVESPGTGELAGDQLVVRRREGSAWRADVLSAEPDRLVLSTPR
jgi:hypothetical protein